MTPLPKRRHSSLRSGKRRKAINKSFTLKLILCPFCKKSIKPHQVCPFCGKYKNEQIFVKKINKNDQEKNRPSTS